MGMGSADFIHANLLKEIDIPTTLINALTAMKKLRDRDDLRVVEEPTQINFESGDFTTSPPPDETATHDNSEQTGCSPSSD